MTSPNHYSSKLPDMTPPDIPSLPQNTVFILIIYPIMGGIIRVIIYNNKWTEWATDHSYSVQRIYLS